MIFEGLTGFRNGNRFAKSLSCLSAKRDPIFLLIQVTKKRIHIRLLLCFSELDACGMYEYVTEIIYLTSYGKRHTAGLVILRAREDHNLGLCYDSAVRSPAQAGSLRQFF